MVRDGAGIENLYRSNDALQRTGYAAAERWRLYVLELTVVS
jgi:hypothetical protein